MKTIDFPQLSEMRSGIEYRFPLECRKWRGAVRPLSAMEIIQTTDRVSKALADLPPNERSDMKASLLLSMAQLELASTDDVGGTPALPQSLLAMMTPDEINHLWKQYVRVCDRVNPSFESLKPEDLAETVEALKKSSDKPSFLTDLSISHLVAVCLRLLEASAQ